MRAAARRKEITFKDFYARFYESVSASNEAQLDKERVRKEVPVKHPVVAGTGNRATSTGLVWKPITEGGDAMNIRVYRTSAG